MNNSIPPQTQKIAEKLTILNDRGTGMLTRISNIKKACSDKDPSSKPAFLNEKSLDPLFKQIVKKFPKFDKESAISQFSQLQVYKNDIAKSLSLYYHTFVDLMELKDQITEVLTTIDVCQIHLDITLNFDLTKNYLDLIVTYVSLLVLLSKVEDRKIVLGLFNIAHEMIHSKEATSFPRLGQLIMDYDSNPMRKLMEDFVPHSRLVYAALKSLNQVYKFRNSSASELRRGRVLNYTCEFNKVSQPTFRDCLFLDCLSFEQIERWICFASTLCLNDMHHQDISDMFKNVLLNSQVHMLYRDDCIQTHMFLLQTLEQAKSTNSNAKKLVEIIKETQSNANSRQQHRDKRQYLRHSLKEMCLLFTDQAGLLGPKASDVFLALCMARDEVHWLLRHQHYHLALTKQPKTVRGNSRRDDWVDKQLPELLFYIEELRGLTRKYAQIIQKYYAEYLSGAYLRFFEQKLQELNGLPQDEEELLNSFSRSLHSLRACGDNFDGLNFKPLRLDWFRFQTYTSVNKQHTFSLLKHATLAKLINSISYYTRLCDSVEDLLMDTSDLSIFCFYPHLFFDNFKLSFEYPHQARYSIAFPLVCSHFINCTHELCPEERQFIGKRSVDMASKVLDEMSKETKEVIFEMCEKYTDLNTKLKITECLPYISDHLLKKLKIKDAKKAKQPQSLPKPGFESSQSNREDMNTMDRLYMAIAEWCSALNYCTSIHVWDYTFYPREYLYQQLEARLNKTIEQRVSYEVQEGKDKKLQVYLKPTEMINLINSYMDCLLSIENHVLLDITKAFNNVLSHQKLTHDPNGHATVTKHYVDFYKEKLLKLLDPTHYVYSPSQKCLVQVSKNTILEYSPEDFINYNEMSALCEILGVVGVKSLVDEVNVLIYEDLIKIKEIVFQNEEILRKMRIEFDRFDVMRDCYRRLEGLDLTLGRLLHIGILISFKKLLGECLNELLDKRVSFLMFSIQDLTNTNQNTKIDLLINDMNSTCGFDSSLDTGLYTLIKSQSTKFTPEEDYKQSCSLMLFLAFALVRLTRHETTSYRVDLQANSNNSHYLAQAIVTLTSCLFYMPHVDRQYDIIEKQLNSFLGCASSALLKLCQENTSDSNATKDFALNKEAVYVVLEQMVQFSAGLLDYSQLEAYFPYALIKSSYRHLLSKSSSLSTNQA